MSASKVRKHPEILKMADIRRELTFKEKKVAEIKREKIRTLADVKPVPKHMITVDLTHARGNLDALKKCLHELEWKEFPFGRKDQNCDIHWQCTSFEQNPDLYAGKVNKFPGMYWICSKNNLFRVLDQMRALYPEEYDFYPRTWYLPEQLPLLAHDIRKMNEKRTKPKPTFIVKPDTGSQGEGIYLIRDVTEYILNTGKQHACQEYLSDVLLIDKYKFDLRVYGVLKSVEPLEFYICNEGLARFSTVPYESPTNKNLNEAFMHLTNYSLNKKSATFNRSERDDEGSKRTLTSVFSRLQRYGYNTDKLWKKIEEILVKTVLAIIPDLKIELQSAIPPNRPGPTCFQILGFDILLLHDLKPMLLEINSSPSLRIDSEVEVAPGVIDFVPSQKDEDVKIPLIRDTLLLVAPQSKVKYLESQKKRKARQARKQRSLEKEAQQRQHREDNQPPVQLNHDGVIHVKTRHPRSSIVIIRADDEQPNKKKLMHQSSFLLPNVRNMITNQDDVYYFRKLDQNENDWGVDLMQTYEHRTDFIDKVEEIEGNDIDDQHSGNASSDVLIANDTEAKQSGDHLKSGEFGESADSSQSKQEVGNSMQENEDGSHKDSFRDNAIEESSNSDDDKVEPEPYQSCLKQLYPEPYKETFDSLRMYEKLSEIFLFCLGVRNIHRLGSTSFRTFARKCHLNQKGLTNASIDILYIDMQRKWEHVNPERTTGLCFRGFLDACHEIAKRKFTSSDVVQSMTEFIEHCEDNLRDDPLYQCRINPRLLMHRARPPRFPHLEPMVTTLQNMPNLEDHSHVMLESRLLAYSKPKSSEDVDLFLRRHGTLDAIKKNKQTKPRNKYMDET